MDGQKQTIYPRKNWSSFILYNCAHPSTKSLTVEKVNNETGAYLHQFKWCQDDEIGSLDERWNWLEGWTSGHNNQKPFAVHYTRGGHGFLNGKMSNMLKSGLKKEMIIFQKNLSNRSKKIYKF